MTDKEFKKTERNAEALLDGRKLSIKGEILQLDYEESSKMSKFKATSLIIEKEWLDYGCTILIDEKRSKEEIELYKLNRELSRLEKSVLINENKIKTINKKISDERKNIKELKELKKIYLKGVNISKED